MMEACSPPTMTADLGRSLSCLSRTLKWEPNLDAGGSHHGVATITTQRKAGATPVPMRYVVKATAVAHPEGEMRGWVAVRFERLGRVELLTVFVADDGSTHKCDGCKAAGGYRNGKIADAAAALIRNGWLPGFTIVDPQAAPVTA